MLRSSGYAPYERTGYFLIAHNDTTTSLWPLAIIPYHFPLPCPPSEHNTQRNFAKT